MRQPDLCASDARDCFAEVGMHRAIGRALRLDNGTRHCVLDLGGGTGATARTLVADDPSLYAVTVTDVPVQNRIAARLDALAGVADRMAHIEADCTRTGLPPAQADGAWALEGTARADFVREAARLLKPGARLVVVDGFLLRPASGRLAGWLHRRWAGSRALQSLARRDDFIATLRANGFDDVEVRSLRWRVALGALHIAASCRALALALFRRDFDYCMVTAKRQGD